MAQTILGLVNVQRASAGVKPLVLTTALDAFATSRSQDMVTRNYFAHTDPDGHDCFWLMTQAGISYMSAGENIAYGQATPQDVMTAWMNSNGHRANILNASFGKLGVGAVSNSAGVIYWTQDFTN